MEFILNGNKQEYTAFINRHEKGHFLQTLSWCGSCLCGQKLYVLHIFVFPAAYI